MTATLIDTHCHVDFDRYDDDRKAVIRRAQEAGLIAIINPAVDVQNSRIVCELAAAHDLIYAAVGIHPNSTAQYKTGLIGDLHALSERRKVVAIGEIGLDYYRDRSPRDRQWRAFEEQLGLATLRKLPVIIHNREASEDVLNILTNWIAGLEADHSLRERPGVLHSFSASTEIAERALALGFYIGITGPVTFKKADDLRRVAAMVPTDRLLIETDGPFLTPYPYRGKRNEPAYVQYVADRIAAVRRATLQDLGRQTTVNAIRLFGLPLTVPDA